MDNAMQNAAEALKNTRSNEAVEKATLGAAFAQHGKESKHGSWLEMPPEQDGQEGIEKMLSELTWKQVSEFPGGAILQAELPAGVWGFQAALPAANVPGEEKVRIDLSIPGHPGAILVGGRAPELCSTVTMIVEHEGGDDPDIQGIAPGFRGPVVATWFPGTSTPRSNPDGVLKNGDIVTVAEAIRHGFGTVKF